MVISEVFRDPVPAAPLAVPVMRWKACRRGEPGSWPCSMMPS